MNNHENQRLLSGRGPRVRWPQLLLIGVLGTSLAILAFFFFVFALIVGVIAVTVIGIRVWWVLRKLRARAKAAAPLKGEYTVVEHTPVAERLER